MPWQKSFNIDEAVELAMQVFWEKSYTGASISDLVNAIGIKRGSLYNAFEGKQDLFVKSLLKYDREHRRAGLIQLESNCEPREAICTLFEAMVSQSISDKDKKGCFLVNTALELPSHTKEVSAIVRAGFQEIENFFERLIKRGQKKSEIPKSIDPNDTAKALLGLVVSIRVLARGAFNETELRIIAQQATRLIS
jgi:TetR/AcrR family transcriptional regulator, transcriptional repressor for nem operon